jgi:hypothetical protein
MLAQAGISLEGAGLPDRRAALNAIMDEAPGALVEQLLRVVLGGVLRPAPQQPSGPADPSPTASAG